MAVVLQPLGVKCNIQCHYCYEDPERDAGNVQHSYDIEKMKAGVEKEGGPFTLFGGEPLLVPEHDLEDLWSWGHKQYGSNTVQSNGTLINENHIRLFKQYKVGVGISVDGPGELNDARWHINLERTRAATEKTHAAIDWLCREGIPPGLIVTLHRHNAASDKLPVMHDWFRRLEGMGVTSVRLHILEVDSEAVRAKYMLSIEENLNALLSFLELQESLTTLKFDLFKDMRNLLLGRDNEITCVWNACDPYTTEAVRGVNGYGQSGNCSMVNKDGVNFVKSGLQGFERYVALYYTPQEYNGCRGCQFFLMCKGQCPGHAVDGDWRNRTEYCEVWKALFRHLEGQLVKEGLTPISLSPTRAELEKACLETWARGDNRTTAHLMEQLGLSQAAAAGHPNSKQ